MTVRTMLAAAALTAGLAAAAGAQPLAGQTLATALRGGGYVIVMRHASAPPAPPARPSPDNPGRQRELDAGGRASAAAMGQAIRRLHIRIGEVWSSPAYWAQQTVRVAGLPAPQVAAALGNQAQAAGQSAWLKAKLAQRPRAHTDTLIVTHAPNIQDALGAAGAGLASGEALVFEPRPGQAPRLVAHIKIEDWPKL